MTASANAAAVATIGLLLTLLVTVTAYEIAHLDADDRREERIKEAVRFYAARCCPARNGQTLLCTDGAKAEEVQVLPP